MNIFKKNKTPEQLVRMAKESLAGGPAGAAGKELGKRLALMKAVLYGEVAAVYFCFWRGALSGYHGA